MSIKRIILGILLAATLAYSMAGNAKQILVYGDSLSAAYGLDLTQGWAHLLAEQLGETHSVINASISGETSTGGLARLPATLDEFSPELVLLELGANDGLRGHSVQKLEENLVAMIELAVEKGAAVVVFGITLPASYGPRYIDAFEATFKNAAATTGQHYYAFVVEQFIGKDEFIQADGLHPTAAAHPEIAALIYQYLDTQALLE